MSQDADYTSLMNPEELYSCACRLYYRPEAKHDPATAAQLLSKASEQGYMRAKALLGFFHLNGIGVPKDPELAVKYFKEALEYDFDAGYGLGFCYAFGVGVEKDTTKALDILDALYSHHWKAQGLVIERILAENIETSKFSEYLEQARSSDDFARIEYDLGRGAYENVRLMRNPYAFAATGRESRLPAQKLGRLELEHYPCEAEVGCLARQFQMAIHYLYSASSQDLKQGLELLHRAAAAHYPDAACLLGYYYERGLKGIAISQDEALKYLSIAAKRHRPYAMFRLAMLQGGSPEEQFRILTIAAQCGVVEAAYELGRCYENGMATAIDATQAVKWYTQAANAGNGQAQYQLARCYRDGFGVSKDETKYIEWVDKAVKSGNHEAIVAQSEDASIF